MIRCLYPLLVPVTNPVALRLNDYVRILYVSILKPHVVKNLLYSFGSVSNDMKIEA